MYEKDLALNDLQWLICHKTQPKFLLFLYFSEGKLAEVESQASKLREDVQRLELERTDLISKVIFLFCAWQLY